MQNVLSSPSIEVVACRVYKYIDKNRLFLRRINDLLEEAHFHLFDRLKIKVITPSMVNPSMIKKS